MAYIIKNTAGLINTRLTDVGRRKLSQGNFNILYFQIGDSEVNYTAVPNYNQTNNNILMPAFNAQNNTGSPQSNKQNIKYPYYVTGGNGGTYGIPFDNSQIQPIYNSAAVKGFFTGTTGNWLVQNTSAYTINSNYWVEMVNLDGTDLITLESDVCEPTTETPSVGDFLTIYLDGFGTCQNVETVPILTYKIQEVSGLNLTLDRPVPDYTSIATAAQYARVHVYPSGMTALYDTVTPAPFWETDALNFEAPCDITNRENTVVWNMNIPWSENPAGLFTNAWEGYTNFGSVSYIGTKEYLGYQENSGQTDTGQVFYYNSFDEKIVLSPSDQKTIAIIHYTNQDIDFVYGEKFSTVPFDPQNPNDDTGLARHLKVTLPTLMWHKTTGTTIGETFMIDPPGYDLCKPYYIKSKVNTDMNDPGIRYFQLWDLNPDVNGNLNRIGKVFPDQQIIIIDDEEIVAAISNKSNRNWTLPAPQLSLLTPNVCFTNNLNSEGLMDNDVERMWVTYLFENTTGFTNSLHCNYYSVIQGPSTGCTDTSKNVAVRFGPEFPFLNSNFSSGDLTGFPANSMKLLCQKVSGDTRPNPTSWKVIDITSQLSASTVNGKLTMNGIVGTTFQIDSASYTAATTYNLSTYISLTPNGSPEIMNFGDEYYFYGNFETDISATIYEMNYLVNLGRNQFTNTSNPTWTSGTTSYVTEIGLYDSDLDLIVVSKLQSPQKRQGIQQFVVKLDF
jgi:hypothetical protein